MSENTQNEYSKSRANDTESEFASDETTERNNLANAENNATPASQIERENAQSLNTEIVDAPNIGRENGKRITRDSNEEHEKVAPINTMKFANALDFDNQSDSTKIAGAESENANSGIADEENFGAKKVENTEEFAKFEGAKFSNETDFNVKLNAGKIANAKRETSSSSAKIAMNDDKNRANQTQNSAEIRANDDEIEREMRKMSRRSFLRGAFAIGAGLAGWNWLTTRRADDGIPWPLRRSLETSGQFAQDLFSSTRLAPTFKKSQISTERVNGAIGLGDDFDVKDWSLNVSGLASGEVLALSLADIKKLPRVEMTTELKCIEGWSIIVNWAGARFSDFAATYPPPTQSGDEPNVKNKPDDLAPYVGLTTPDGAYYVGMDMASALHPQTLLCYEMNGKPLTSEHGAPLRLVTPVKYGIKHIKRIGNIEYSNRRPADYWAEQGYDWYAGH